MGRRSRRVPVLNGLECGKNRGAQFAAEFNLAFQSSDPCRLGPGTARQAFIQVESFDEVSMSAASQEEVSSGRNHRQPQSYVVRFGAMRHLGVFRWNKPEALRQWAEVVVRTDRGTEAGVVLRRAEPEAFKALGNGVPLARGVILRLMNDADRQELRRLAQREREELAVCQELVANLKLPMKLVRVEHLLGGERIIVYFCAANRVDFRELVRQLARKFRTRIEMRQIGVRDEARLLADYGDCGKPVCCNTHLVVIPPISMHMAKVQRATLDPAKISGRCGRLKCCLRYEYETYQELLERCPPIGAEVRCGEGVGIVVGQELLREHVWVNFEGRGIKLVPVAELEVLALPAKPQEEQPSEEGGEELESAGLEPATLAEAASSEEEVPDAPQSGDQAP